MKFTPTIRSSLFALGVALAWASALPAANFRATAREARNLPPIVFVSRRPVHGPQVPGVGPEGRTLATGGRLLVRRSNGRIDSLAATARLFDVSDPSVSWDARTIVFAGLVHPDSAWRLFLVGADGRGLLQVTRSDRALDLAGFSTRFDRYDDFDPCFLPDGRIVFASTRFPQRAQEGGLAVSNLFVVQPDGSGLERITSERNGAEEPAIDPRTGRVVYARWFLNPYLATDATGGLTFDRTTALPADTVDFWQAVTIFPDGDRIELAAGNLRSRLRVGGYQPCVLADGTVLGVDPGVPSMIGGPGATRVVSFGRVLGEPPVEVLRHALSPVDVGKGRIAVAVSAPLEPHSSSPSPVIHSGSYGLYAVSLRNQQVERIVDFPGTDELDPAPLVRRKVPPILPAQGGVDDPAWTLPVTRLDQVQRMDDTFRFDCLNVYLTGPVDSPFPDAPRIAKGARIRFFAALARPEAATGDTVVLVREAKLEASGAVHESDIPGDVPLFEQLVDANGRVMRSAHGPAHVPGMNFSRIGSGTKCVGCHEGHSALPVPKNNFEAKWFNASTSAAVTVSSGKGAGELVDRRAKGTMGWVAEAAEGQWARLTWPLAVEARSIVLYAFDLDGKTGSDLQVRECQLVFYRDGREVGRATAGRIRPGGTRIDFAPVQLDAIEVRPTRIQGKVNGRPAAALAEIETIARMIE